jgi:hypothetical protein
VWRCARRSFCPLASQVAGSRRWSPLSCGRKRGPDRFPGSGSRSQKCPMSPPHCATCNSLCRCLNEHSFVARRCAESQPQGRYVETAFSRRSLLFFIHRIVSPTRPFILAAFHYRTSPPALSPYTRSSTGPCEFSPTSPHFPAVARFKTAKGHCHVTARHPDHRSPLRNCLSLNKSTCEKMFRTVRNQATSRLVIGIITA